MKKNQKMKLQKPSVYGTGLIALDLVISANPDNPIYGWAGGTCGNVLTILSYLGWNSFPVARLNGDTASVRVKKDLQKWKVNLDHAQLSPTADTPIITQIISEEPDGTVRHKFSWRCPKCKAWLPGYKAVTKEPIKETLEKIQSPKVFFFDRVSPGALILAEHCKNLGAVVIFEPSASGNLEQLEKAFKVSHIVKYSKERFKKYLADIAKKIPPVLEIQTIGSEGILYKSQLSNHRRSEWKHLQAFTPKTIRDTCGCGDWTTAGIIESLCTQGFEGFSKLTQQQIENGLNLGQAYAAWNCAFEGARGGMYQIEQESFKKQIKQILSGRPEQKDSSSSTDIVHKGYKIPREEVCPACGLH